MDESVLGTPFYVMEYLEGRIFTDVRMPEISSKEERIEWYVSLTIITVTYTDSYFPPELFPLSLTSSRRNHLSLDSTLFFFHNRIVGNQ